MLEKSDLMAIENMFNRFEEKMDQKLDQKLDRRFKVFEKIMDKKLDKKLAKMEKKSEKMDLLLLDEIERNRNILEMRMDKMQQDIDEVKTEVRQLYRITGQENERVDIEFAELRRKDSELDKRVTKLEDCAMA